MKGLSVQGFATIMKNWIMKYRTNQLANNTGWMLLGQGLCLFIQAAYFVIIARSLGVQQYGAFIAAAAFAQILSPFVGFGGGNLLVKNVAQDKKLFAVYWGNLLFMTLTSGLAATAFVIAVARLVLPRSIPLLVIVLVSLADLIFSRLIECAAFAFQAIERLDVTAKLRIWAALTRLIGIAVLAAILHHPAARHWSFVYLLTTIIGATLGLAWVQMRIGRPRLSLSAMRGEFIQGLYFSASLSAQNIYNDIDKTMLARMATLDAVGIYAVAYRIIDIAFIPVRSLLYSAYAGFFRAGQDGISGTIRYMRRLLPKSACYSFLAFLGLNLGWLSLLPLLKTIHYFLADTLTCSGHQGCRALIQGGVAGFNVLINLWIIPLYSWRGAAWSSVASDTLLAASMYLAVLVMSRASKQTNRYQADAVRRASMACGPGNAVENVDPVSLLCVNVTSPPNRARADILWR
jgi:O-antigen/teichoic acid export membrane protein